MIDPSSVRTVQRAPKGVARVIVLVPVLNRPARVRPLLESFVASLAHLDLRQLGRVHPLPGLEDSGVFGLFPAEILFLANEDDFEEIAALEDAHAPTAVLSRERRSWAQKINLGAELTCAPWILCGADDLSFHRGWFEAAMRFDDVAAGVDVVGTNDLGNPATMTGETSTHPLVRRRYVDELGTVDELGAVVHGGYHHNFPDTELVLTAKMRGRYRHAPECVLEHLHPIWRKGDDDETYALGRSRFEDDRALFESRRRTYGF